MLLICNINIFVTINQEKVKNSLIIVILILVSNIILAQSAFDKYDGQEGVISIIVNKKMFQMMGNVKMCMVIVISYRLPLSGNQLQIATM